MSVFNLASVQQNLYVQPLFRMRHCISTYDTCTSQLTA